MAEHWAGLLPPAAAKRSNDANDEEKANGAALLPAPVPRSDDDRAEEKPAVKSAVAATPGPISVKKVQLLSAAKRAGLDDEMSQRLWIALVADVSATESRRGRRRSRRRSRRMRRVRSLGSEA